MLYPLQWRHDEHYGVSNHQRLDFLLKRLLRCRSMETSKLRVTGFCEGNSPVTGEFPAQRASNAENVSIWWHYHAILFHNDIFPQRWAARTPYISSWVITINCRLYSKHCCYKKTWGYLNKFDSTKSLGLCYWCVKIPQCRYMEHRLKHITFYVQKRIAALAMCHNPALVRDKPLGSPASVKLVYGRPSNMVLSYDYTSLGANWSHSIGRPLLCFWHQNFLLLRKLWLKGTQESVTTIISSSVSSVTVYEHLDLLSTFDDTWTVRFYWSVTLNKRG